MTIHAFDTVTSTNDEARNRRYGHGDVIRAECQTAGRGQRGHTWTSTPGENLTFTVVLEPTFLAVRRQFLLSEAVAVALTDGFAAFGIDTRIKWTNDIYAGHRKICGVLIEHNWSGAMLGRTLVGIGINVNQTCFDPALPNPTSMRCETGSPHDREAVLEGVLRAIEARFAQLLTEAGTAELERIYDSRLYDRGVRRPFRRPDGRLFEGIIRRVEATGELILEENDGLEHPYCFKEVDFVLKK